MKAVLLGCWVLLLEADISQYSVYFHSLWNIQTQILEEMRFSLSESQGRINSLRWANTQQRSRKDTFILSFGRRFPAISEMLLFDWRNAFSPSSQKEFMNSCEHTSVQLCKLNAHISVCSVRLLRLGFRSRYFSIQRLLPFTLEYQNGAPRSNALLTLWISRQIQLP